MAQTCPPSVQACKTRTVLTLQQALHIFQIKQSNASSRESERESAAAVARSFGVSEKTVRDIWAGRTWVREMMHLDPARAAKAGSLKLPGRPKKRAKTGEYHQSFQAKPQASAYLCDCNIEILSETAFGTFICVIRDEPSDLSSQSNLAMKISKTSNAIADDPFHDDWPHWAGADIWEQHASEGGFIAHPSACT
jgi:hypothetical protein